MQRALALLFLAKCLVLEFQRSHRYVLSVADLSCSPVISTSSSENMGVLWRVYILFRYLWIWPSDLVGILSHAKSALACLKAGGGDWLSHSLIATGITLLASVLSLTQYCAPAGWEYNMS